MMPPHITEYRWRIFPGREGEPGLVLHPRYENDGSRLTIRTGGKEYVYSAEASKYPPETEPVWNPSLDAPNAVIAILRLQSIKEWIIRLLSGQV